MTLASKRFQQHPLLEVEENAIMRDKRMNLGEVQIRRWAGSNQVEEHIQDRLACKHSSSQDMQDPPTDQTRHRLAWEGAMAMDNHLLLLVDTNLLTQHTLHMEHHLRNQVWLGSLRV